MLVAIAVAFIFSLREVVNKFSISNLMRPFSWFYLFTAINVIAFPVISWMMTPMVFPSIQSWILLLVSSTAAVVGGMVFMYALSIGEMTTGNPVLATRPIFVVPLSFIFLGEFYGFGVVGWILLIVFGAVLTSWNEKTKPGNFFRNKAFILFILATLIYAVMSVSSKPVLQELNSINYVGWWNIAQIPSLLILMPLVLKKNEISSLKKKWKPAFPYAILESSLLYAGTLGMFFALSFSVSLSEALIATQGLFAVVVGLIITRINPKIISEKHSMKIYLIRLVGAALILAGAYNILV